MPASRAIYFFQICPAHPLHLYGISILKKLFLTFGLTAGLIVTGAAHADIGVTGDFGSTGVGAHATVPLTPNLNARFGVNYLGYTHSGSTSDLNYDFKLKANTYDALLDWYPMQNSAFRLTGGLAYNGNKIDVHAKPNQTGSYTISGRTYSAAEAGRIEGSVDFRKVAPYIGIGWGNAVAKEKGWSFSADVGVLFQGSPNTALNHTGCSAAAPICNQLGADIAREKVALANEVGKYKTYPVLRIGINYKF
jgi:opacity protein-like surface antigen